MTDYHWLITVTATVDGGQKIGTYSNVLAWNVEREDRYDVFLDRFAHACQELGSDPTSTYVLCWSFEPNLGG